MSDFTEHIPNFGILAIEEINEIKRNRAKVVFIVQSANPRALDIVNTAANALDAITFFCKNPSKHTVEIHLTSGRSELIDIHHPVIHDLINGITRQVTRTTRPSRSFSLRR